MQILMHLVCIYSLVPFVCFFSLSLLLGWKFCMFTLRGIVSDAQLSTAFGTISCLKFSANHLLQQTVDDEVFPFSSVIGEMSHLGNSTGLFGNVRVMYFLLTFTLKMWQISIVISFFKLMVLESAGFISMTPVCVCCAENAINLLLPTRV